MHGTRTTYLPDWTRLQQSQKDAIYDQIIDVINEGCSKSKKLSEEQLDIIADATYQMHDDFHNAMNKFMGVVITNCNIIPTPVDIGRVNIMVLRMFAERFVCGLLVCHRTGEVSTPQLVHYFKKYLTQLSIVFMMGMGKEGIDITDIITDDDED
jgi:hypothetical protein